MFQFRRFPTYTYLIQCMILRYCLSVFPHSEISGSQLICSSPKLIAACHVLHRLLMPRHSPCALISLTYFLLVFAIAVLELCRLHIRLFFEIVIVLPLIKKFHNYWFRYLPLCCLAFFILSLFSFQGAKRRYTVVYPQN